jgi:hypothetical protein
MIRVTANVYRLIQRWRLMINQNYGRLLLLAPSNTPPPFDVAAAAISTVAPSLGRTYQERFGSESSHQMTSPPQASG